MMKVDSLIFVISEIRQVDLFEVHLIPDSEGEEKVIEDIYLDMLVSVIDRNVEKTDDYEKRISEEYRIIRE